MLPFPVCSMGRIQSKLGRIQEKWNIAIESNASDICE